MAQESPVISPSFTEFVLVVISDLERFQDERTWHLRTLEIANAAEPENTVIQIRLKRVATERRRALAAHLREHVKSRVPLFLNGDPELAMDLGFDGIHFPERDALTLGPRSCKLPFTIAAHTESTVKHAASIGAQAAIVSPVYPSSWKATCPLGINGLERIVRRSPLSIIALGGITPDRVRDCLRVGVKGIATLSGIMAEDAPANALDTYLTILKQFQSNWIHENSTKTRK